MVGEVKRGFEQSIAEGFSRSYHDQGSSRVARVRAMVRGVISKFMTSIQAIPHTISEGVSFLWMQVQGVPIWEMIGERVILFPSSRESVSAMVVIDRPWMVSGRYTKHVLSDVWSADCFFRMVCLGNATSRRSHWVEDYQKEVSVFSKFPWLVSFSSYPSTPLSSYSSSFALTLTLNLDPSLLHFRPWIPSHRS